MAIFFVIVQAMSDLSLPDYMSDIVNKGIQQGGIVNAVPEAIRKTQMDKLLLFVSDRDKEKILNDYKLIDRSSSEYEKYLKKYPLLSKEAVYVLKKVDNEEIDKLNIPMAKALLAVAGIEKAKANAKNGVIEFNGKQIPANIDIFMLLSQLPNDQLLKIREELNKKFSSLGDNMVVQAAAAGYLC